MWWQTGSANKSINVGEIDVNLSWSGVRSDDAVASELSECQGSSRQSDTSSNNVDKVNQTPQSLKGAIKLRRIYLRHTVST